MAGIENLTARLSVAVDGTQYLGYGVSLGWGIPGRDRGSALAGLRDLGFLSPPARARSCSSMDSARVTSAACDMATSFASQNVKGW
jgi:hypothetical protein